MDENLNSAELSVDSQCGDSGERREKPFEIKEGGGLFSGVDGPSAGTTVGSNDGSGESDCNSSKKVPPPNLVKCDICLCEMSSGLVLNSHINGSRHKKRMKALEIVANLKAAGEIGVNLESDKGSSAYRCEVCSLTVNSPQQLEIHLAGAKHKNRTAREKLLNIVVNVTNQNNQDSPPMKKRKKDSKVLFCDVCNVMLNSETQYEQHVVSKKHMGRAVGDNRKKRVNRLDKIPNLLSGNRFHDSIEPDRTNCHTESGNQQYPGNNMSRLHQVHSHRTSRSNVAFNQMNSIGPPFGNYYQPRPLLNNHRNLGGSFGRIVETGKFISKTRPQLFNSHPDSVIQSSSSNS